MKPHASLKVAFGIIMALAVFGSLIGCSWPSGTGQATATASTRVEVPPLEGVRFEEAAAALESLGLVPVMKFPAPSRGRSECIGAYWYDPVGETEPAAGALVADGGRVLVVPEAPRPDSEWRGSGHVDALKAGGPTWCFECHPPESCTECHLREAPHAATEWE